MDAHQWSLVPVVVGAIAYALPRLAYAVVRLVIARAALEGSTPDERPAILRALSNSPGEDVTETDRP